MLYLDLGRRELGKTTLAYYLAQKCPYRVIFDPRGMIAIQGTGVRVTSIEGLKGIADQMDDPKAPLTEIIVTPRTDVQATFDACARLVESWAQDYPNKAHAIMFVVDEARFVNLQESAAFGWILRAAPRDLCHVIITAHRPADIPTDVRAIADHWLLFRFAQEHDLKVIGERCGTKVAGEVSRLKPYQYVHWDDGVGKASTNLNSAGWFVPLRAPSERADTILPASAVDKRDLFDPE